MMLALLVLADGQLHRSDGILLLSGFFAVVYWMLRAARSSTPQNVDALAIEFAEELRAGQVSTTKALLWTGSGLAVLLISSRMLVWGAVEIAQIFHVSDLIIGLTIVAVGTSLPELAATMSAALKDEDDIASTRPAGIDPARSVCARGAHSRFPGNDGFYANVLHYGVWI
jgi:cation:H+ antiporter